ncbi:hypothetical protein Acid345_0113 [Candidatus Koribacter versatilis Ellin345]|uniref:Uncharacterized protein n=1 Tax=Koribacter versatilis (strain Ellin345) TaxID=204669 RepID=Q1IVI2_KORVE|nr:hypothetical protein [Candidatus Koribacter versatilis]ABF39118.1 hypothetical protein Acid345_0113 [Candidatus Koribacter versatilis Ellin345]
MDTNTILILALGVVLIALASVIIPYINALRRYAGYSELRDDARAIEFFLRGETFRDLNDLVITGNTQSYRTTLRFSKEENTPAVNIRMDVPATFDMMLVPKDSPVTEGGQVVKTGNDQFDAKWVLRSNQPTQAKIFVAGDTTMKQIKKLCCSSRTFVEIQRGALEISELTLPEGSPSRHLIDHMESMAVIGKQLALMPGAAQVKVERVSAPRPTSKVLAAVIAVVAVCTGIAALANYEHSKKMNAAMVGSGGSPVGIPADEALHIPDLQGWRLADSPDFDPSLVQWLRSSHVQPTGRLEGDFAGGGAGADHAYLLVNTNGGHRLVVLVNNQVKLDQQFNEVVLVAKVPKSAIRSIKIENGSPATGNADGILVVTNKDDLHSGVVVSFNGNSPVTAVPQNYKSTTLE